MKSASVRLTVLAALALAARAQQVADPCAAASFNGKACKRAVRQGGYCSGGAWISTGYSEKYPYYFGLYQDYLAAGGVVNPAEPSGCGGHGGWFFAGSHGAARGGFGSTGHCAHG